MSHPESHFSLAGAECRLVIVQDESQPCPYRADTVARMPLHLPIGNVSPQVTDRLLELGYRRSGDFVYRTQCPSCDECKPTRVDVSKFRVTRSMKRVLQRGDRDLICQWGPAQVDQQRVLMFNDHRAVRNLGQGIPVDVMSYRSFLGDSCCHTTELSVYLRDDIVAISIMDVGETSTSAVYTHFAPAASRYSLGTYAILKQIEWAIASGRQFVYLGMYVADNQHLNYKARFLPQQRLCDGTWVELDD